MEILKKLTKKLLDKLHLKFYRNKKIIIPVNFFYKLIHEINIIDLGSENYSHKVDPSYKDLVLNFKTNIWCFDFLGNSSLKSLLNFPKAKFNFINEAVYDGSKQKFYECTPQAASGIYPPNEKWWARLGYPTSIKNTISVNTKRLDDLISNDVSIDLMKLDIQGAELVALQNSNVILNNVSFVQCESDFTELFIGAPLFPEIYNFMISNKFRFFSFSSLGLFSLDGVKRIKDNGDVDFRSSHYWSRQLAWSIAIFYREPEYFKDSPEKILNAAAIAHCTYKAYDLARSILHDGARFIPNGNEVLKEYENILSKYKIYITK